MKKTFELDDLESIKGGLKLIEQRKLGNIQVDQSGSLDQWEKGLKKVGIIGQPTIGTEERFLRPSSSVFEQFPASSLKPKAGRRRTGKVTRRGRGRGKNVAESDSDTNGDGEGGGGRGGRGFAFADWNRNLIDTDDGDQYLLEWDQVGFRESTLWQVGKGIPCSSSRLLKQLAQSVTKPEALEFLKYSLEQTQPLYKQGGLGKMSLFAATPIPSHKDSVRGRSGGSIRSGGDLGGETAEEKGRGEDEAEENESESSLVTMIRKKQGNADIDTRNVASPWLNDLLATDIETSAQLRASRRNNTQANPVSAVDAVESSR